MTRKQKIATTGIPFLQKYVNPSILRLIEKEDKPGMYLLGPFHSDTIFILPIYLPLSLWLLRNNETALKQKQNNSAYRM